MTRSIFNEEPHTFTHTKRLVQVAGSRIIHGGLGVLKVVLIPSPHTSMICTYNTSHALDRNSALQRSHAGSK